MTITYSVTPGLVLISTALVFGLGWLAARKWYLAEADRDEQLLDAMWEICDAMDWPGPLGQRLQRVMDEPWEEPLDDVQDDPTVDYDKQWRDQGRIPAPRQLDESPAELIGDPDAVEEYMRADESPAEVVAGRD